MASFNSYIYPQNGNRIDNLDKHTSYLVKIKAPTDVCLAFHEYSNAFHYAAHLIGSYLLETKLTDISKLDTYIFSLAFLYRHSIELELKAIAFQSLTTPADRSSFVKNTFHNLQEILETIENISSSPRKDEEIVWLRSYFKNISKIDKESDSFRYPFHIVRQRTNLSETNKFNIKRIFEKQTHINLLKFANKFEAAHEILEKWYSHTKDVATEWRNLSPVFIEEGGPYYGQSVVGYDYNMADFFPYTRAYLDTANYLKQYMKEQFDSGKSSKVEQLFIPMCYLYRNCTELSLKTIWFEKTNIKFQFRCKMMLKKKHSITGMWNLIKPYAKEYVTCDDDEEYIDILENYCHQLQGLDSDASIFRYPVRKNMKPYFNTERRFDFINTGDFLEALNNALDNIYSEMCQMDEIRAENEAEYRQEMMSNIESY